MIWSNSYVTGMPLYWEAQSRSRLEHPPHGTALPVSVAKMCQPTTAHVQGEQSRLFEL